MRRIAALGLAFIAAAALAGDAAAQGTSRREPPPQGAFACGTKRYCTQMTSCAEAMFHFQVCGLRRLDGDSDGVPCERLCGQGRSTRRR
ncbi:excalibur calcium-binding domain-containing protein [Roseomonas sp. HF4]|uniref:excalibur calcium-binding domain-containing protein n=1 Tax=Roseomonas sp. HF4 TaxID=2562313 RepID=UPI0010C10D76|nr:excalibur calcium-binding domain-containing protein [Roseomonas sp. HF4]